MSISLPPDDLAFVDQYAERTGSRSRSSVVHRAIALLRESDLAEAYEQAWSDWSTSADAPLWEQTSGDGLD